MASKLALRTLGAIALPGAFLAMAAPAASAAEIPAVAPLSHADGQTSTTDTQDSDSGSAHDATGLMSGKSLSL